MQKYQYEIAEIHPNILFILSTMLIWPIKAVSALIANIRKSTNIMAFILRRLGIESH
jgi:hypothetical protein